MVGFSLFEFGFWKLAVDGRRRGGAPWPLASFILVSCFAAPALAQVEAYEGTVFPEEVGWERRPVGYPQGQRTLVKGWFVQTVRLPEGSPGPTGERDFYRMELNRFVGVDNFFVEWRTITDNPSWLIDEWQVPAALSASGDATTYHTTISASVARFLRHLALPIVFVDIDSTMPHAYRVEIGEKVFTWYVDGVPLETGVPLATYPDSTAFLIWGVSRDYVDATTAWDYVRAGKIAEDASGDYDSDGEVTLFDYYFVYDCLTKDGPIGIFGGPGRSAGPGCRFTDFDFDSDVDLFDFAEFQNLFGTSHP